MNSRDRFILGCLALSGVCHVGQYILGMKLARRYEEERLKTIMLVGMGRYLVDMLEKNDVSVSPFDIIALRELGVDVTVNVEGE